MAREDLCNLVIHIIVYSLRLVTIKKDQDSQQELIDAKNHVQSYNMPMLLKYLYNYYLAKHQDSSMHL